MRVEARLIGDDTNYFVVLVFELHSYSKNEKVEFEVNGSSTRLY
jgi:hypothetical protein